MAELQTYHYAPKLNVHSSKVQRIAAYARVSTLSEEQELSFETQCKYYESLISKDENKILVGVYGDRGVSGLSTKGRTEFSRLIEDCQKGKIDMVMTRSVSRFSRNMSEGGKVVQMLKAFSIPIVFEKENIISTEAKNELFLGILSALAQEESHSLSCRVKWAQQKRAEIGDPIRACVYGYIKAPRRKTKHWVSDEGREWMIDENAAKRIRTAFEMASQLFTYAAIVDQLNCLEKDENTGRFWNQPQVKRLLTHEAYKGDLLVGKTYTVDYLSKKVAKNKGERPQYYIEEHHVPIVTAEQFETVQRYVDAGFLHSRNHKQREKFEQGTCRI